MNKRELIDNILQEVIKCEITECNAIDKLFELTIPVQKYSVALVYTRNNKNGTQNIDLRNVITGGLNENEALGIAITFLEEETKGYNLSNKCVIKIENGE